MWSTSHQVREVRGAAVVGWVPSPRRALHARWVARRLSRSRGAPPWARGVRWSMVTDQRLMRPVHGSR